jgi:hypothetical protein
MLPKEVSDALGSLLIRWHHWSANPRLSTDTTMREFDQLVGSLYPCMRIALIVEARNLACGSAVWSNARVRSRYMRVNARSAIMKLLSSHQHKWFGREMVTYNERGNRIGESNPRAKLTDHEVDLLREMRDERKPDGSHRYSLGFLALRFKQPKSTVQDICSGRRRAQTVAQVREG